MASAGHTDSAAQGGECWLYTRCTFVPLGTILWICCWAQSREKTWMMKTINSSIFIANKMHFIFIYLYPKAYWIVCIFLKRKKLPPLIGKFRMSVWWKTTFPLLFSLSSISRGNTRGQNDKMDKEEEATLIQEGATLGWRLVLHLAIPPP